MTICPEVRSAEVISSLHSRIGRPTPQQPEDKDDDEAVASPIVAAVEATEMMTPIPAAHHPHHDESFHRRTPPDGFTTKFQY